MGNRVGADSPLPGTLREQPLGSVLVPAASSKDEGELFRDAARSLQGDAVLILARRHVLPVTIADGMDLSPGKAQDSVKVCDQLAAAVKAELQAQGIGLGPASLRQTLLKRLATACSRCSKGKSNMGGDTTHVSDTSLKSLLKHIIRHIAVGPALQVALACRLPPALWQAKFVVCIGAGQIRVCTFVFVGEPVSGDRPESKRTPFAVRLLSEDLVPDALANAPLAASTVCYEGQLVQSGVSSMLEHIAVHAEAKLFAAVESGDWSAMLPSIFTSFLSNRSLGGGSKKGESGISGNASIGKPSAIAEQT